MSAEESKRKHSELVADIAKLDGTDLSIIFLEEGFEVVYTMLRKLAKHVKKTEETGLHVVDMSFVASDLGRTDEEKRGKLRNLKALMEKHWRSQGIDLRIRVKGSRSIVDIEPNVFSSNVSFEEFEEDAPAA